MAKITKLGGFSDASVRGFVSPADVLRSRGKLGPYDKPAGEVVDPVQPIEGVGVVVESDTAGTGESVNADTGEVTQPGDPLPEISQTEGVALEPAEKEEPCPGNSSETSPAKPRKTAASSKSSRRKRARTTGGRSGSTGASGTARTGTTSGPETDG